MTNQYDCTLLVVTQHSLGESMELEPFQALMARLEEAEVFSTVRLASLAGGPSILEQLEFVPEGDLVVVPLIVTDQREWQADLESQLAGHVDRFRVLISRSIANHPALLSHDSTMAEVCLDLAIDRMTAIGFAA